MPDTVADIVSLARQLATEAHRAIDQRDKLDRDYVDGHLVPVAAGCALFGPEAEAAGWLHDVIEDTGKTADDLRLAGLPHDVVAAVESVTKRPDEPYLQLIHRAAADPLGAQVKLVDNAWNILSSPDLARREPQDVAKRLREKYLPARGTLLAATGVTASQVHEVDLVLREHLSRLAGQ